jgi:hypothetical protein
MAGLKQEHKVWLTTAKAQLKAAKGSVSQVDKRRYAKEPWLKDDLVALVETIDTSLRTLDAIVEGNDG